jgi:hypothetical protein
MLVFFASLYAVADVILSENLAQLGAVYVHLDVVH